MLYLLYGDNQELARVKSKELVSSLLKKKPDASFFKINDEQWNESLLDGYIGSQGLFESKYIVLLENLLENKEIKEVFLKKLREIKESENIFILRAGELDKVSLAKLEKNSAKVQKFNTAPSFSSSFLPNKKEEVKLFALADALGKRDKKSLWTLYCKAKQFSPFLSHSQSGVPVEDEQIHGILFWQIKNMILANESGDAREAGLNPFVFSKAKAFAKNYSKDELKKMSNDLMHIYHEARRGLCELEGAVERWILAM
jgi:DNA polymerase III delta subunit